MLDNNPSLYKRLLATDPLISEINDKLLALRERHGCKIPAEIQQLIRARNARRDEIDEICLITRRRIVDTIDGSGSSYEALTSSQQVLLFQTYNTKGLIYADCFRLRTSLPFWIATTIDAPNTVVNIEYPTKWLFQIYPNYDHAIVEFDYENCRFLLLHELSSEGDSYSVRDVIIEHFSGLAGGMKR